MRWCLFVLGMTSLSASASGVSILTLNFEQVVESPRWMFEVKAPSKGTPLIRAMMEAKRALVAHDRASCLSALQKTLAQGKSLAPWLAWNQLQCAAFKDKAGKLSVSALSQAVSQVEAQPRWLSVGPSAPLLRSAYTAALQALVQEQIKTERRSAWSTIDKLQQVRSWLTADERANVYRWAGELAFIEQNLAAAQDFMARSLSERDNAEVRSRIESIRAALLGKKKELSTLEISKPALEPSPSDVGVSSDERDLLKRMNDAYASMDYISAIEDGVELIRQFPGSRHASEANDRVLEIYLALASRTEEKYRHARESAVKEMRKVDSGRLAKWAQTAYARGNYLDALNLAEQAYEKFDGHPDATKTILLAGKSAVAAGEYESARRHFETLLKKHAGSVESAEAAFRLGLLDFRLKRYAPAAADFERLLALGQGKDFELRALYWQWRAQQKIDLEKSTDFAKPLIKKFPFSYYGLRAQAELNGGAVAIAEKPLAVKADMRFLDSERLAWERFNILLKAGWLKEAERELDSLPAPQSPEERLIRAKYWAACLRYDIAIALVNKVLEENPEWLRPNLLKVVYPQEYSSIVARESKAAGVSESWLLSLMRQESSFRPEVKSPSGALGVMQILPATGAELARDLKVKDFAPESLLNPEINIKLGSAYLARLVRSFSGNYPLALAAYNAGPTRLKRWLNLRKDLSPLESSASSAPEVEVWMDELPWDETSHYVKSILRNWLAYRLLSSHNLSLSEPIWMDAKTAAR